MLVRYFKTCTGVRTIRVDITPRCDNNCIYCIRKKDPVKQSNEVPTLDAIMDEVSKYIDKTDEVLLIGGEPLLYLELCVMITKWIKSNHPKVKVGTITSLPYRCFKELDAFEDLIKNIDWMNVSIQHKSNKVADKLRGTVSKYDRIAFICRYHKYFDKIRISLNLVKGYLDTKGDVIAHIRYFENLGFSNMRLTELRLMPEYFVSIEDLFGIKIKTYYSNGCTDSYPASKLCDELKDSKMNLSIVRSCFMSDKNRKATFMDKFKYLIKKII